MTVFPMDFVKGTSPEMRIAVIAITGRGAVLAGRLSEAIPAAECHVSSRYADRINTPCNLFEPTELRPLIANLWKKFDGLILIMATGIVVRMIAPLLESKATDPAIVVMDEAGRHAISLLSGHLGGANELADRCALASGGHPVVTTATDTNDLPSFDVLAKEQGWVIDDISRVKHLNTLLLDNKEIAVCDPTGRSGTWLSHRDNISYYATDTEAVESGAAGAVLITSAFIPPQLDRESVLILRPRTLVLGIGCNRGTPVDEIDEFVALHLARLNLSPKSVCCIASVAAKRNEAGLREYAERLGVPFRCFENDELNRIACPSPPSAHALAAVGVVGVAEPAAILASGGGKLLLEKVKSANVTLAIAELKEG